MVGNTYKVLIPAFFPFTGVSYKFNGTRFDCGDKAGFQMANLAFALEHPEIKDTLREYIENILMKKEVL